MICSHLLRLLRCTSPAEIIKIKLEPVVGVLVYQMILITDCGDKVYNEAFRSIIILSTRMSDVRSLGVIPSLSARFSVVVPYSSVPQIYKVRLLRVRLYLAKTSADIVEPMRLPR